MGRLWQIISAKNFASDEFGGRRASSKLSLGLIRKDLPSLCRVRLAVEGSVLRDLVVVGCRDPSAVRSGCWRKLCEGLCSCNLKFVRVRRRHSLSLV